MSYIPYNPNPQGKLEIGDCVIRAISKALNYDWERTYIELALQGFIMADMPSSNAVWGSYLIEKGFEEHLLVRRCRECYSIQDFCKDHPIGIYIVGTGSHAACIKDGNLYDSFDSSNMNPTYYFEKMEMKEGGINDKSN